MLLCEFPNNLKKILNKMSFPQFDLPLNFKIFWLEAVDLMQINNYITKDVHKHSFLEVHFVFSGKVEYWRENETFEANCGQAFIIPANENHKFISCSEDVVKIAIAFFCNVAIAEKENVFEFQKEIADSFSKIFAFCGEDNAFTPSLVLCEAVKILYSVFKNLSIPLPKSSNIRHDPRFLVAKSFIENNIDKRITISQIANECCLSQKQLNRIFTKETGSSVSDYLNSVKIKTAKKWLCEKELSVKEIGYTIGFENESSFIPFFKKHCNDTPGNYRKRMSEK